MLLNWARHYTGIETAELGGRWLSLYMQRDARTKRLQMARMHVRRTMLGVFVGRTNYVKGKYSNAHGVEVFTNNMHVGVVREWRCAVDWSGSFRDPYYAYTLRLGPFGIGGTTDKWLKRIVEWRARRAYERMSARYDEMYDTQGDQDAAYAAEHEDC